MTSSETPYRFENAGGYSVIAIQPELNDSQWADFEKVGNDLLQQIGSAAQPSIIIDLSSLSYMGSAMVALIVRIWKHIQENKGKMVVVNSNEMVFEVLKLAGLSNVWTIVATREEGLKQLGKRPAAVGAAGGDGGSGMALIGAVGVIGALVGLALMWKGIGAPKVPMAITFGFAALGLFGGTMSASKGSGTQQTLGIGVVIASVAALLVGIVAMPTGQAAPLPPPNDGESLVPPGTHKPIKEKKRRSKNDEESTNDADSSDTDKEDPAADADQGEKTEADADDKTAGSESDKAEGNKKPSLKPTKGTFSKQD